MKKTVKYFLIGSLAPLYLYLHIFIYWSQTLLADNGSTLFLFVYFAAVFSSNSKIILMLIIIFIIYEIFVLSVLLS